MVDYSEERFREGQMLLINKPLDWTSFDVVNKMRSLIRWKYNIKKIKVGHAGTLDPLATGLVIVCTGKATKQIESYMGMEKEYIADIRFGATTPTFDLETEPDHTYEWEHITKEMIDAALLKFTGPIEQIPPAFSALKINGRKAYELAREGKEVELKARSIQVSSIDLLNFNAKEIKVNVTCSKGTYIRSLARDIGYEVNSGGHLSGLIRSRIGDYKLSDAMTIEEFEKNIRGFETKQ